MHGEITGFYVEANANGTHTHVVMTVTDPDEGNSKTVRVSQADLAAMSEAEPRYDPGPPQTTTPPRTPA